MQHAEFFNQGIKPMAPAVEAFNLNHWATREVLLTLLNKTEHSNLHLVGL